MPRYLERGAVYAEFLIVFGPLALFWLSIGHLGLAFAAHLVVNHAAAKAVRAAVVVLPDEADDYQGDPLLAIAQDGEGLDAYGQAVQGGRLDTIRKAARIVLAPISPSLPGQAADGLASLFAGYLWTAYAVAVTFPDGNGGYRTRFEPSGPLTARVTYLYRCPVPLANRLFCHRYFGVGSLADSALGNSLSDDDQLAKLAALLDSGIGDEARSVLDTVGGATLGSAGLGLSLFDEGRFAIGGAADWWFLALTAERTLPMQGKQR